uniref:CCHC-type domain-containing protein n=1 Tax=Anser brachyrhynchus TaxID=132585 RepID=A0A8B9CDZ6_9AVES
MAFPVEVRANALQIVGKRCFRCQATGHLAVECPQRGMGEGRSNPAPPSCRSRYNTESQNRLGWKRPPRSSSPTSRTAPFGTLGCTK